MTIKLRFPQQNILDPQLLGTHPRDRSHFPQNVACYQTDSGYLSPIHLQYIRANNIIIIIKSNDFFLKIKIESNTGK